MLEENHLKNFAGDQRNMNESINRLVTMQRFDLTRETNNRSTNVRFDNSFGISPTQRPLAKAIGGIIFFSR